eukprot:TRINITY_DN11719_c0_g1_i5.p1 TRINITY_DN11719_c0_g1~~TRINITY_DN11719_c0_g1_i5.p1  ORF type:complete len:484 (+),score=6.81 TRINITY_DN11719_c0_g1_i5:98-1549(+)
MARRTAIFNVAKLVAICGFGLQLYWIFGFEVPLRPGQDVSQACKARSQFPFRLHHYARSEEEYIGLRTDAHRFQAEESRKHVWQAKLKKIATGAVCFDRFGSLVSVAIAALRKRPWRDRAREYHSEGYCVEDYGHPESVCQGSGHGWAYNGFPSLNISGKVNVTYLVHTPSAGNWRSRARMIHTQGARTRLRKTGTECRKHFLVAMLQINADMGEARYIAEWLDAHTLAGFDHFYVYAIGSSAATQLRPILADYIKWGVVTYAESLQFEFARAWYLDAYKALRRNSFWVAILELDEFLFPDPLYLNRSLGVRNPNTDAGIPQRTLADILVPYTKRCYPLSPNIVEGPWAFRPGQFMVPFTSYGPRAAPGIPEGSVLDRFLYRHPMHSFGSPTLVIDALRLHIGKSITLTDALSDPSSNFPHWQHLKSGYSFLPSASAVWFYFAGTDWWINTYYFVILYFGSILCVILVLLKLLCLLCKRPLQD